MKKTFIGFMVFIFITLTCILCDTLISKHRVIQVFIPTCPDQALPKMKHYLYGIDEPLYWHKYNPTKNCLELIS